MIELNITIEQQPAPEGRVGCRLELKIESTKPQPEEVQTAAMLLEKIRELAEEICQHEGVRMNVIETRIPKPRVD